MKERDKMQKNEPSLTSIRQMVLEIFQSQELEQDESRHFEGSEPHFHTNKTSQIQSCKTMKKRKCDISTVFCSICLKSCRLLELGKRISLDFKFRCYGNTTVYH